MIVELALPLSGPTVLFHRHKNPDTIRSDRDGLSPDMVSVWYVKDVPRSERPYGQSMREFALAKVMLALNCPRHATGVVKVFG